MQYFRRLSLHVGTRTVIDKTFPDFTLFYCDKYHFAKAVFHLVPPHYSIYPNNCTIIIYNTIQTCGSHPTCFGVFRSSSGRYLTKETTIMAIYVIDCNFFFVAPQPPVGHGLLIIEASRSHSDTPHSVGVLWTSDQPDAETSDYATFTKDRYASFRWDSNPQSQPANGRRPIT
jgi:hypothetical protein